MEYISTNIRGGYSSFDLHKGNSRKYHALLMAGEQGFERIKILASLNEVLVQSSGTSTDISNNIYRGNFNSSVQDYLQSVFYLPNPTQVIKINNVKIVRSYIFSENDNELKISYRVSTPEKISLIIEPLFTCNAIHTIGLKLQLNQVSLKEEKFSQLINLSDKYSLTISSSYSKLNPPQIQSQKKLEVSHNHYYPLETERGYEAEEDLIKILKYTIDIQPGVTEFEFDFTVRIKEKSLKIFQVLRETFDTSDNYSILSDLSRFKNLYPTCPPDFAEFLVYNARKFIVADNNRHSLIAGYHWFGEWSRDTFISFKGILLGLGRIHEASQVLLDWSKYISLGLLPNTMQGLHYNSLDGVLWYIQAVWYYWEYTNDRTTIKKLLPKLESIISGLSVGSKYGVRINSKGFLIWQDQSKALTWMDTVIEGVPVIDRSGACVEIQALWYSSLQIVEALAKSNDYKLANLSLVDEIEALLEMNLEESFWLDNKGFYADFISNDGSVDQELRPNQLALFALPFRIKNLKHYDQVLVHVEKDLLTDLGLRTLAPSSKYFNDNYQGDQYNRDRAYHQGTVWPWLFVLYGNAKLNTSRMFTQNEQEVSQLLDRVWKVLSARKAITISELFWSKDLYPGGAIAQAWSVAAIMELVMNLHKKR